MEQLAPCAGPRSGGSWKNHGQHVSAVAKTAEEFLAQGLINESQKEPLIAIAARTGREKGRARRLIALPVRSVGPVGRIGLS